MSDGWAEVRERGAYWGIFFVASVYRLLGRTMSRAVLVPVATYFYLTGGAQRRASSDYLNRAWQAGLLSRPPGLLSGFRHFVTFSWAALDKLAAWTGGIRRSDIEGVGGDRFETARNSGRGALVLTAHLGNPEVVRAIASISGRFRINVLVHTIHAEMFNRVIQRFAPDSPVRLVQVTEIDLATAMGLAEAVERGEWIVMTGDRVAVKERKASSVMVDFLGAPAPFAVGPYILASALRCPVYTLFCLKHRKRYAVEFEAFADPVELPRGRRGEAIRTYAQTFARRLERAVARAPFQWFNFYDYWPSRLTGQPRRVRSANAESVRPET
ncbi:MAG: lipid A biosynthesis acyltransferase [Alphaproteobacteria bacterium]|nr:lipid A biosynthesis acyltransferase [Alphaproteobacteria bacterium]